MKSIFHSLFLNRSSSSWHHSAVCLLSLLLSIWLDEHSACSVAWSTYYAYSLRCFFVLMFWTCDCIYISVFINSEILMPFDLIYVIFLLLNLYFRWNTTRTSWFWFSGFSFVFYYYDLVNFFLYSIIFFCLWIKDIDLGIMLFLNERWNLTFRQFSVRPSGFEMSICCSWCNCQPCPGAYLSWIFILCFLLLRWIHILPNDQKWIFILCPGAYQMIICHPHNEYGQMVLDIFVLCSFFRSFSDLPINSGQLQWSKATSASSKILIYFLLTVVF